MIRKPALLRAPAHQQNIDSRPMPAPIGGWNARDPEATMKMTEALWLENFWPSTADVQVRKGAANHVTGFGANILSLMAYTSPTQKKLFAATATGIYDATTAGTAGAAVKAVSDGRLNSLLFSVLGGTWLLAVNGTDKLIAYDGTTWNSIDNTTTPAITGIATDQLSNLCLFKRRVWFIQKDSLSAWYLPVNSIAGAAVELPLGQLFPKGGHLVACFDWTIDGGQGSDDYLCFMTSEGEVAVYKGTDPTSGTGDFGLVGVYYVGEPVGHKCWIKYGGDVIILTQTGLYPLSKALLNATINRSAALSNKIDIIFSQSATAYGSNYGWCMEVYPTENLFLANVPTQDGYSSNQLVMNTITGSWALFTGWNAFCWEILDQTLYFGGAGFVAQAFTGYADFGANIVAKAKTAFNYFGSHGRNKHFKLIRPIIKVDGEIGIELGINTDFEDVDEQGNIVFGPTIVSKWDEAVWDQALWSAEYSARREWRTVFNKEGFCAALRLRVATSGVRVGWSSTDFTFEKGGIL